MNPTEILLKVLRKGWKTSEFWLSVGGLVGVPTILAQADVLVDKTTGKISATGIIGSLASGAIVGAYNVGRAYLKGKTAAAILTPVAPPLDPTLVAAANYVAGQAYMLAQDGAPPFPAPAGARWEQRGIGASMRYILVTGTE